MMKQIKLKPTVSVDTVDITEFIRKNTKKEWNECCHIFSADLDKYENEYPNEIQLEVEFRIWKVIVKKLKTDGWIKKFTETQGLNEDYYILFIN